MRRTLFVCLSSAILAASFASAGAYAATQMETLASTLHPSQFTPRVENLIKQGRLAQAVELADLGIARNPKNAQLQFMRSVALERLGRTEEAAKQLRSLISQYPEIPEPYNNLAVIEAGFGNLEDAVRLLQQALGLNAQFATARKNLGDVYLALALENYEKAAPVLKENAELAQRVKTIRRLTGKTPD